MLRRVRLRRRRPEFSTCAANVQVGFGRVALFWRIWAAVSLVNALVLSVFVALAALQFASINATLVGERLVVLAGRTVAPFATSARLGLPLSAVRNAPALLERARQTDEDIVALHVFDAEGRIVHSTASPAPVAIATDVAAARSAAGGAPWYRETTDGFICGVDVAAADGSSAGGILIVYPGRGNLTQVRSMIAELLEGAFVALLAAAALGTLILRIGLAGAIRYFKAIDTACGDFERGAWRRAAGHEWATPDRDRATLSDQLWSAAGRYRATGKSLAAARRESE